MTEMEKKVWAAAFASAYESERWQRMNTPGPHESVDDISGYSCAEIADAALDKFREAMTSDSREHLALMKEAKPGDAFLISKAPGIKRCCGTCASFNGATGGWCSFYDTATTADWGSECDKYNPEVD